MIRLILLLCVLVCSGPNLLATSYRPSPGAELFNQANSLYEEDRFGEALEAYEQILAMGYTQPHVLANAGNAAYKAGDRGRAVLYYLRALRIDPSNDLARQNLSRVQPRTNVSTEDELLLSIRIWFQGVPLWFWIVILEISFIGGLLVLLIAAWRVRSTQELTEWYVRAGGLFLVAAVAGGAGLLSTVATHGRGDAIVMTDGVVTRMGPGERYLEHLSLPAGTLVDLPESPSDGWVRCRLKDGRTGYIRTEHLERV